MKADKEKLGRLGEELVAEVLGGTLSADYYDDVKDMTLADGTQVEVKTQVRWKRENAFTIDDTITGRNLEKCLEVDMLIFVEPGKNNIIRLYECTDRSYTVKRPRGIKTFLFPINRMKLIHETKNPLLCEEMIEAANTNRGWLV